MTFLKTWISWREGQVEKAMKLQDFVSRGDVAL